MKMITYLSAFAIACLLSFPTAAGVYQYQDENGKWHFTDKPPKDKGASTVVTTFTAQKIKSDLREDLHQEFNPASKSGRRPRHF